MLGCAIPWRTSIDGAPSAPHLSGHGSCGSMFVPVTGVSRAVPAVMSPAEFQPILLVLPTSPAVMDCIVPPKM